MTHMPYKGAAPAMTDVMGGQIQIVAATVMSAMPAIQGGKLKALGVTTSKCSSALPNVPTVAESALPGFEATAWSMVVAPAKTPRAVITRTQADIAHFLQEPDVRARLAKEGSEPVGSTPEEAAAYLRAEVKRWAGVVKEAGLQN